MRRLYRLRSRLPEPFRERLRRIRAVFLSLGLSAEGNFPQSAEEISASAGISIVIAALDPPPLERCLASVERFAAGAEVILVDDGSVLPETRAVIQEFVAKNGWKLLRNEHAAGTQPSLRSRVRGWQHGRICAF